MSIAYSLSRLLPHLDIRSCPTAQLDGQVALGTVNELRTSLAQHQGAVLSVSGGKSPIALFDILRQALLDWSRVTITLVDERFVPFEHFGSNARLVHAHLVQDAAAQQSRMLAAPSVLMLDMGSDGHMASLFPMFEGLAVALALDNHRGCDS